MTQHRHRRAGDCSASGAADTSQAIAGCSGHAASRRPHFSCHLSLIGPTWSKAVSTIRQDATACPGAARWVRQLFYKQFSSQCNTPELYVGPVSHLQGTNQCNTIAEPWLSPAAQQEAGRLAGSSSGGFHDTEYSPERLPLCKVTYKWPRQKAREAKASNSSSWPVEMAVESKASSVLLIMGDWDRIITGHQPGNVTLSALSFFLKLLLKLLMLCSFPKRREEKKIICCRGFIWDTAKPVSLWAHPRA